MHPENVAQGFTQVADVYGPRCNPGLRRGLRQGHSRGPLGSAAANSPVLSRLNEVVVAACLADTLNDPNASYTVFAPANAAFEALPADTVEQLLADPQGRLAEILRYHVVPQRYDAQALADAGTVTTVEGSELTISGERARSPLTSRNRPRSSAATSRPRTEPSS